MSDFSAAVVTWVGSHPVESSALFVAGVCLLGWWTGRRMFG